jgi:hypothetical protein
MSETKALEELIAVKIKSYDGELRKQAAVELFELKMKISNQIGDIQRQGHALDEARRILRKHTDLLSWVGYDDEAARWLSANQEVEK